MDMAAVLREVDSWPVEERLRLMDAVWDRMVDSGWEPELTDAQRVELKRRLDSHDANPKNAISWEDVQTYVSRRDPSVTEQLNVVYGEESSELDPTLARLQARSLHGERG